MTLAVLVVEIEADGDTAGDLEAAMNELRKVLRAREVPVRRAWAGIRDVADAVAAAYDGPADA